MCCALNTGLEGWVTFPSKCPYLMYSGNCCRDVCMLFGDTFCRCALNGISERWRGFWCALIRIRMEKEVLEVIRMWVKLLSIVVWLSTSWGRDPLVLDWSRSPEALVKDDYDTVNYPEGSETFPRLVQWSLKKTVSSTGRNYTIHIGSLNSGLPDTFSFQLPEGGRKEDMLALN